MSTQVGGCWPNDPQGIHGPLTDDPVHDLCTVSIFSPFGRWEPMGCAVSQENRSIGTPCQLSLQLIERREILVEGENPEVLRRPLEALPIDFPAPGDPSRAPPEIPFERRRHRAGVPIENNDLVLNAVSKVDLIDHVPEAFIRLRLVRFQDVAAHAANTDPDQHNPGH